MRIKVLLCWAILLTSYLDNNSHLKKVKKAIKMISIDHDSEELSPVVKRRRKGIGHLDFVLPTRKSLRKMVAEFSLICYKDMAESIINANANGQTVSYGSDDTIKAAENKKIDIKTVYVTKNSSKRERESF